MIKFMKRPLAVTLGLSSLFHGLIFLGRLDLNISEFDGRLAGIDIINVDLLDNFAIPQDGLMAQDSGESVKPIEKESEKIEEGAEKEPAPSIVEICQKNPVPAAEASPVALRSGALLRHRDSYRGEILKKISRVKFYPRLARQKGQEGRVTVEFTLRDDGALAGPAVIKNGCDYDSLNLAALKTIERANPFPSFPANLRGEPMTFYLDITFFLSDNSELIKDRKGGEGFILSEDSVLDRKTVDN